MNALAYIQIKEIILQKCQKVLKTLKFKQENIKLLKSIYINIGEVKY